MAWISELIDYISTFDVDYRDAVKPAQAPEIDEFSTVLRREIPAVYREFLESVGGYDGGLFHALRADTRIERVTRYCRDIVEDGDDEFDVCIPFAKGDVFDGLGLHVGLDQDNPPLVTLDWALPDDRITDDLASFAFQHAFMWELAAGRVCLRYEGFPSGADLASAESGLADAGYVRESFSDGSLCCARGPRALVTAFMGAPGGKLAMQVCAEDERAALTAGAEILQAAELGQALRGGRPTMLTKKATLSEVRAHGGARTEVLAEYEA